MKQALITVSNKLGIENLAFSLVQRGYRIVSTGGTATHLRKFNVPVTDVSEVTDFPEILDARVKILHPAIFGPTISKETEAHNKELRKFNWSPFSIVVVNFYPFESMIAKPDCTFAVANDNMDIGGPAIVRTAVKGNRYVVVDPSEYDHLLNCLDDPLSEKMKNHLTLLSSQLLRRHDQVAQIKACTDVGQMTRWYRELLAISVLDVTSNYDKAIREYRATQVFR